MEWSGQFLLYLPLASFALSVGALVAKFYEKSAGAIAQLGTALILFLIFASATTGIILFRERSHTEALADEVVVIIGNHKKTYDEILTEVKNPNRASLAIALELLDSEKRIGTEIATFVAKEDEKTYRVRTYYVRTFN